MSYAQTHPTTPQKNLNQEIKTLYNLTKTDPALTRAYENLGRALFTATRLTEAIDTIRQGLSTDPASPNLYHLLANTLKAEGQLQAAAAAYQTALCLNTKDYIALANLGAVHKHLGNYQQAEKCLTKALSMNPNQKIALYNLGIVHEQMWEFDKAYDCFDNSIAIDPNFAEPYRNKYLTTRQLCNFQKSQACEADLDRLKADDPFISIIRSEDPEKNLQTATTWSQELSANIPKALFKPTRHKKSSRIHLGYLSNDFRTHPIGTMTAPLFKLHNRNRFKVSAYSYGSDDQSIERQTIENNSDNFIDLKDLGIYESAKKINDDKVDILIDLTGYTENHRLEIMAMRPAKTQITYLGFPGSLGADFIDFLIADRNVIPQEHERWYKEKILTLPHCYQINSFEPKIPITKLTKQSVGLPPKGFVFASFNQSYKIDQDIWKSWMNILKQIDGSVLCLWQQAPESTKNLRKAAGTLGISEQRLIFWETIPKADHLARVSLVDLALDTRVYGGHTTTTDCLRVGVPLVTKVGNHFASRVCASILKEVDLEELITSSPEEYESLAVHLARNPQKLRSLKKKLTHKRLATNLFNTKRFVKNLETLYENCLR